jgi:ABC-type glucose/galactose transport system permease subunit
VSLGRITFPTYWLFALVAAAVLAAAVWLVVERTSLGLAIRAATQDPTMAAVLGVNVQRLNTIVFALGSGLAGAAGVILGTMTSLSPQMGAGIVLDAFIAIVIGGLGSFTGRHRRLAAARPGPELRRGAPARLPHAADLPRDGRRARAAAERPLRRGGAAVRRPARLPRWRRR